MSCKENQHNFNPISSSSYFKRAGGNTAIGLPKMDQSISYKMVICSNCGDSKEVVAADYREEKP